MLKDMVLTHKTYGPGTVLAETADTVSVHFKVGRGTTRKFLIAALFDDDLFPRDRNAALWKVRALKHHHHSTALKQVNETDAIQAATDLARRRTPPNP